MPELHQDGRDAPVEPVPTSNGGLAVLLGVSAILLIALLLVSVLHPAMVERVKFFTVNALSLLVLVAIAVQAYIYRRQWHVMSGQWQAMRDGLRQNERAVQASEQSAKIAEEAFHVGEAPYFGLHNISFSELNIGRHPGITVVLLNGGKTPAWRVHTKVKFVFGNDPESEQNWQMEDASPELANRFVPSGEQRTLHFRQSSYVLTPEHERMISAGEKHFFVIVEVHFRDFRRVWHSRIFRSVWRQGHFDDYDSSNLECAICRKKGNAAAD